MKNWTTQNKTRESSHRNPRLGTTRWECALPGKSNCCNNGQNAAPSQYLTCVFPVFIISRNIRKRPIKANTACLNLRFSSAFPELTPANHTRCSVHLALNRNLTSPLDLPSHQPPQSRTNINWRGAHLHLQNLGRFTLHLTSPWQPHHQSINIVSLAHSTDSTATRPTDFRSPPSPRIFFAIHDPRPQKWWS